MVGVVVDIDKILKADYLKNIMNKRVKSKIPSPNFLSENRRGQVTIFIIIAIVLITAVSLYFIFRDKITVGNSTSETDPIYNYMISCLEKTSNEGISYLAAHGGYYNLPGILSLNYLGRDINYYYLNSKIYTPSIERVESELENYLFDKLNVCLDFEEFENQGFEINKGDLVISANIKENEIDIDLNYPITIRKGETTERLKEFEVKIESNIEKLLFVSEEIVNSYSETPGFICLTCLEEISENNDVEIKATPLSEISLVEDNIVWFSVSNSEYELKWEFIVEE